MIVTSLLHPIGCQQGHRDHPLPRRPRPALPERFRGRPRLDTRRCADGCRACAEACPTEAISAGRRAWPSTWAAASSATACTEACPDRRLAFTRDFRLATRAPARTWCCAPDKELQLAEALNERDAARSSAAP